MATSSENVEQAIATYLQASEANRSTPGRHGNVVSITKDLGDEVVITGDLHGNHWIFERLVQLADLDGHPRRHLLMQEVCHGGPAYPSTSACMSHLLLEEVAQLKCQFPDRFHFILGNHELAEITDFPITKANRMLNLTFRCGLQEMYGAEAERVREASLVFLRNCPLAIRMDNGLFVCHSAPDRVAEEGFDTDVFERPLRDEDLDPEGAVFRLLWGRDCRAENGAAFAELVGARVLVHGHEPCTGAFKIIGSHQIILDCCGSQAGYMIVPTDKDLTHDQAVALVGELA
jgi:hypothetical protein